MRKTMTKIIIYSALGILIGLLLCFLGYLLVRQKLQLNEVSGDWTFQYDAELTEFVRETTEEEEEEAAESTTVAESATSDILTITSLKTDGETVTVTNPNEGSSQYFTLMESGIRYFTVIYAQDDVSVEATRTMNEGIEKLTGLPLPSVTEDADDSAAYEILIGDTECTESQAVYALIADGGYAVVVKGNKIVIAGNDNFNLQQAVKAFLNSAEMTDGSMKVEKTLSIIHKEDK